MSASTEGIKAGAAAGPALGRFAGEVRRRYLVGTLSVVGGLLVWEVLSRLVVANALFLAAPSQIAVAIYSLARSGELGHHIAVSGAEFIIGYVIASVIGIGLGLAMASSERAKQALQPWISGLYATPTIALAPLFILWLGIGIWSKVAGGDLPGAVPGHHQYRGGAAHHERAPDRDAAQLRRDAAADLLQGVAALGPARSSSPASSSASAAA